RVSRRQLATGERIALQTARLLRTGTARDQLPTTDSYRGCATRTDVHSARARGLHSKPRAGETLHSRAGPHGLGAMACLALEGFGKRREAIVLPGAGHQRSQEGRRETHAGHADGPAQPRTLLRSAQAARLE